MGELLNDRYELGDVVGSGGMGAVYRATDTRLGRTVAVKILRGGPLTDDVARARMRSEASLAASINHPGVAQVYDYEEDQSAHGGLTFIVMEFIEGHSLAQLLRERGPMPADQVLSVVVQVAEGLQAAHDAGIVHRDLKPANIMLTPKGRTVLVDFGIARSATSEPLTSTGAMVGTAEYMSPEQSSGRSATPQSDLYALGVVAFHCLTGESPFRRESHIATALAHVQDDLPNVGPEVPAEAMRLVASLTAKNPSDRPTSAGAVALEAAGIGAAGVIDLPPTFEMPVGEPTTVEPTRIAAVAAAPRRRTALYAGVSAAVLVLAFLGWQTMGSSDPSVVPNVVGMSATDAKAMLRGADMAATASTVDVAGAPAGQVVKQAPKAGATEPDGEPVELTIASGKVTVAADSIIGLTYAKASATLEKLGLQVSRKDVTQSEGAGKVVALDKSGSLPDHSAITLSVAVAPAPVTAPAQSTGTASPSSGSSGSNGQAASNGKANGKAKGKSEKKKKSKNKK